MSVKVGVRVRPFNKRQLQLSCRSCVQMQDKTTRLTDSEGNVKNFVFDYSFWSHDKYMIDPDGIYIPVDDKYADQQRVYKEIGSSILVNAWEGYNCCLFAYGQTGSGKSYSMIGYGANKGIIPIVCDEIFKKINANGQKTKSFEVMVSMMEIYNQSVRDLLQKNKKKQLKICESKKLGVYVEGLYKHPVHSYQQIAKKIDQGSNNRSIASTLMNESSSRSHTIVSINFVQRIQLSPAQTSIKYSCIHLVDLAGSQCVAKTGIDSKDRLRQTAKINQSLSTLGRVIQILAENSSKVEKQFVPYRDSKLTFILRNALGGNSRTAMICAISPADDNLQETLSTLRYANRAKKIENKAIINESDVDKLIRMLRQENQMLKKMLQQAKFTKTVINQEVISNYHRMSQNMVQFGILDNNDDSLLGDMDIQLQDEQNNKNRINEVDEQQQAYRNSQKIMLDDHKGQNKNNMPYITNISEDQLLSFRVKYNCQQLMIGNKEGMPKPDVVLAALGIQPNHARIYVEGQTQKNIKRVFLEVLCEEAEDYTYINGQSVQAKRQRELFDNDRLIFGTGCIFLVVIFGGEQRNNESNIKIEDIDYEYAIKQMQNVNLDKSTRSVFQNEEQIRKKIFSQVQKQYEAIKKQNQQNLKRQVQQQQKQYEQKLKEIESKQNQQTLKLKEQLQRKHQQASQLQLEKSKIRQQIQKYQILQRSMQQRIVSASTKQQSQRSLQTDQLQKTNQILLQKLREIGLLQQKIGEINKQNIQKQVLIKQQIQRQEQLVQQQLQVKTIMCNNENLITQYRLELIKKTKNSRQLREILVKKQKVFLQKQLIQLVPMVQKFNLMGRQMKRRIEAGLSIEYKYISELEIIEALKNSTYRSKLKILIHVINKEENRGYYWTTDVFKNRFEHANDVFEGYFSKNHSGYQSINIDKLRDPYWEPETFQIYGVSYLSLECLLYQFEFKGNLTIVYLGKKLGEIEAKVTPLINQGGNCIKVENNEDSIQIHNPRDLIERSLSFEISLQNLQLQSLSQIQRVRIEYEILETNYKIKRYQTDQIQVGKFKQFSYIKNHTITDISENTILHYTDKPVAFYVTAILKISDDDQLTNRQSFLSSRVSSFANVSSFTKGTQQSDHLKILQQIEVQGFTQVAPPSNKKLNLSDQKMPRVNKTGVIVQNTDIMSKIDTQYQKKRKQAQQIEEQQRKQIRSQNDKKKKGQNCEIY